MSSNYNTFLIETERFTLSTIQEKDTKAVFETINSLGLINFIPFFDWPMTLEQAAKWCNKSIMGLIQNNEFLFLARNKEDLFPIGSIFLNLTSQHCAEVGYWVSENWQGYGSASEILEAVIQFALDQCNITTLSATVALENFISIRVLRKKGFNIVGNKDVSTVKGNIIKSFIMEKNVTKAK